MTVLFHGSGRYSGLSTDTKPTPLQGHTFVEEDTGIFWVYDGTDWRSLNDPVAGDGSVVYNEAGLDVDYRWEGDTEANLLYLNAGLDSVGIGTSAPAATLEVAGDLLVVGKTSSTVAYPIVLKGVEGDATGNAYGTEALVQLEAHSLHPNYGSVNRPVSAIYLNHSDEAGNDSSGFIDFLVAAGNATAAGQVRMRLASNGALHFFDSDVAHGMTSLVATSVYSSLGLIDGDEGGLHLVGYAEVDRATQITGRAVTPQTSASGQGVLQLVGQKKSGTTVGDLADSDNLLGIVNNGTTVHMIKGNGDLTINNLSNTIWTVKDTSVAQSGTITKAIGSRWAGIVITGSRTSGGGFITSKIYAVNISASGDATIGVIEQGGSSGSATDSAAAGGAAHTLSFAGTTLTLTNDHAGNVDIEMVGFGTALV